MLPRDLNDGLYLLDTARRDRTSRTMQPLIDCIFIPVRVLILNIEEDILRADDRLKTSSRIGHLRGTDLGISRRHVRIQSEHLISSARTQFAPFLSTDRSTARLTFLRVMRCL